MSCEESYFYITYLLKKHLYFNINHLSLSTDNIEISHDEMFKSLNIIITFENGKINVNIYSSKQKHYFK